jgi:branched-chain amino acid transport system ATP-binding protein
MSGGEQQMLAIGRALMSAPKVLMLDEPSLGLMPKFVDIVLQTVQRMRDAGLTVLLVEQNVRKALEVSDRVYVLQTGRIVLSGTAEECRESDMIRKAYLGM